MIFAGHFLYRVPKIILACRIRFIDFNFQLIEVFKHVQLFNYSQVFNRRGWGGGGGRGWNSRRVVKNIEK